jgi:hypothetical protein
MHSSLFSPSFFLFKTKKHIFYLKLNIQQTFFKPKQNTPLPRWGGTKQPWDKQKESPFA